MINTILSFFLPNSHALFLLPSKVVAYGATPYFCARNPSAAKAEIALSKADSVSAYTHISKTLQPGPADTWHVGLPLKFFTLINLRLPAAANDSLDQAVRYALLRHVPFDLSQARVGYDRTHGSAGVDLEVSVIAEDYLESLSMALGQADIHPASVFPSLAYMARAHGRDGVYVSGGEGVAEAVVLEKGSIVFHAWDDMPAGVTMAIFLNSISPILKNRPQPPEHVFAWECSMPGEALAKALELDAENAASFAPVFSRNLLEGAPFRIDLNQPGMMNKRRLSLWLRLGLATLFLLALAAFPLGGVLGKRAHLQHLEAEIARIRSQAEVITEKRLEVQNIADFLENIALEARDQPSILELLHELTQVLPGNAWLESFVFAQNRVRIQGRADSATSIIEAMENSPLFRDVRFESPVTKSRDQDVFQISADLDN